MAVSATLTWLLTVLNARLTRRFRDRVTVALETHVATLQASVSGLEHQERSDYLDRLDVLRTQIFVLDHMYASVLNTLGWLVRLTITLALLASIHPALLLLAVFAVPTVVSSARRPAAERRVEERCAPHGRLAEHFFRLATGPDAGKEVRVTGIAPELASPTPPGVAALVLPHRARPLGDRCLIVECLGRLRPGLRGRGGLRCRRPAGTGGIGSAHSGGGRSTLRLRWGDHRRDRLPAGHLDGRCSPTGLAGGLRPFVHRRPLIVEVPSRLTKRDRPQLG